MENRRLYQRIKTNLDGVLFFNDTEYGCKIINMSENGMGVLINCSERTAERIKDQKAVICFIEEGSLFFQISKIQMCGIRALRIERWDKNRFYLGCSVVENEWEYYKYIESKKAKLFIANNIEST